MHPNIPRNFPHSNSILITGSKHLKPIVTVKKYGHNWKRDSITSCKAKSIKPSSDKSRLSTSNKSIGKGNKDLKRDNFAKCVKNCLALTNHHSRTENGKTAGELRKQ